jgi:hypothetical protein
VKKVELTVPSEMRVQLTEFDAWTHDTKLNLPIMYDGKDWQAAVEAILAAERFADVVKIDKLMKGLDKTTVGGLNNRCPKCGAYPGFFCIENSVMIDPPHKERGA